VELVGESSDVQLIGESSDEELVELVGERFDEELVDYGEGKEEVGAEGEAVAEVKNVQEVINNKGAESLKVKPSDPYDFG